MYHRLTQFDDMPKKATHDIIEGLCELIIPFTVIIAITCGCFSLSSHLREVDSLLASAAQDIAP